MSEWISITLWDKCVDMARPGYVFEIRNADGQSLFTPCVLPLPKMPFDWKSSAVQFRIVAEPRPQHSTPIPPSKG